MPLTRHDVTQMLLQASAALKRGEPTVRLVMVDGERMVDADELATRCRLWLAGEQARELLKAAAATAREVEGA